MRNCRHCLKAAHQTLLIMLAEVFALELLVPASLKNSVLVVLVVGAVRSLDCARTIPLRASSGTGRPAMRFGGLAWLAHRGGCPQGCAHTERVCHTQREFVVRLQRAVGSVRWQDMRGRSAPLQHMQRGGTQSGGAEGCIAQERQGQSAALHKSCTGNRASLTQHLSQNGTRKEGLNSLKFVCGETYHILVSAPLTRRASAIAVMPSAV